MFIGDKEVGEGWESMSCPYCQDFMVVWHQGAFFDPTAPFTVHMRQIHKILIADLIRWNQ